MWLDRLAYMVASAMFHQPRLLRLLARQLRASPSLAAAVPIAATVTAVRDMLERETAFARDGYAPVMFNGEFVIGQEQGAAHTRARGCLHALLPTPAQVAQTTAGALPGLLAELRDELRQGRPFDLIKDLMIELVSSALASAYAAPPPALPRDVVEAARWLGAQLLIGSVAPSAEVQRAMRSEAVLRSFFAGLDGKLDPAWPTQVRDTAERQRLAIGLLWVGHPATVQAGALILQELLSRPALYARLRADTSLHDATDVAARARLRDHVLELMRFRPPFPILARAPRRKAVFPRDDQDVLQAPAGTTLALVLGALHDPDAQREDPDEYAPGRHFHYAVDRQLMFGASGRYCIAQDQVLEILVSALAALLALDDSGLGRPLRYANRWWPRRIAYDGPVITRLRLRF